MTDVGPVARIFVRYIVGAIVGSSVTDAVLADSDLMNVIGVVLGAVLAALVERAYLLAKRYGWAT